MVNKEKKNINQEQIEFFKKIKHSIPSNQSLVEVVSELLGVENNAAYCRIRGEKLLNFDELVAICRHFQISFDSIAGGIVDSKQIQCDYTPLDLRNINGFVDYLQCMSKKVENIKSGIEPEIIISASDLSSFNLLAYKELTLFKLFSWSKNVYGYCATYNEFVNDLSDNKLLESILKKIVANYQLIPSTEIWMNNTIDPFLGLISYHYEMGHFSDAKIPLMLCNQMQDMMSTMQKWAEKGAKGAKNTPFNLYISEIGVSNTYVLMKTAKSTACMFRLYTINRLITYDDVFCRETEDWLRNLVQRGTLISGASEKARHKFFNKQQMKISTLIDRLCR